VVDGEPLVQLIDRQQALNRPSSLFDSLPMSLISPAMTGRRWSTPTSRRPRDTCISQTRIFSSYRPGVPGKRVQVGLNIADSVSSHYSTNSECEGGCESVALRAAKRSIGLLSSEPPVMNGAVDTRWLRRGSTRPCRCPR
jgi:hypothetical protein